MHFAHIRDFLILLGQRFVATRCPQAAGSLAFTTLLAIVPLLTVAIAVFGNFPAFAQLGDNLRDFLLDHLLPETAGKIVATYALEFTEKAGNLTFIGSLLLIVTALLLMLTIDATLNTIWGVRRPRPLLARITIYWVALTAGPLLLGGSIAATSYLISISLGMVNDPPWLRLILFRMLPVVLLAALFTFLYLSIPNRRVNPGHAAIGGTAAALIFVAMQRGLGLYFANFPAYTLIYGAFATLPIFLLWLYLSWVAILLGAILAATFPAYLTRIRALPDFPGAQAYGALLILKHLADAQREGRTEDAETLFRRARQTNASGEALLDAMLEAGWVARSDEQAWLLARRIDDIRLADVLRRFALAPEPLDALTDDPLAPRARAHFAHMLAHGDMPLSALLPRLDATPAD
ncbi:MAG: YihY family inner membrane protein [Rhodocyclaceae bacterium]|nr:YihY family inner membrane protein [Rhodocyclaceae bacterium]